MPPKNEGPPRNASVAYFQKKEKADSDGKRRRRNDNVAKMEVYATNRTGAVMAPVVGKRRGKTPIGRLAFPDSLGFDGAGGGVPGDGDVSAEAGLVHHVAGERGVVAEDGIFGERLARFDRREVGPEVRTNVVEVVAAENVVFEHRLFADL